MAFVTIYTVDGVEYSEREVTVRTQTRCDACGEFVAPGDACTATVTIYGPRIPNYTKQAHAHANHLIAAVSDLAAELLAEAGQ